MGFIKKQHEARFIRIPYFRKLLEQFRQQPQQNAGVSQRAILIQLGRMQHINHTLAVLVGLQKVIQTDGRLAKQPLATLPVQTQQGALNRTQTGSRYIAVFGAQCSALFVQINQHGAQIF